jgi:endonuclease/exonuclease/phosphatase family metal-dependent hydrolase
MYPDSLIVLAGDLNDEPGSPPLNALDSSSLLRTASDKSLNEQCTYNYGGCSKIDHIYLSLEGAGEYVPYSSEVIKDGGCGYGPYCLGSSDHAALKAEFYLGEDGGTIPLLPRSGSDVFK